MRKNYPFLCSLLFLSPAMHAMETSALNASFDDAGECFAYEHPLRDKFPEIVEYVVHSGCVLDILNTRLACKLFAGQVIDTLPKEQLEQLKEMSKSNFLALQIYSRENSSWLLKAFVRDKVLCDTPYPLHQPVAKENELLFKMGMTKIIGYFKGEEEAFIWELIYHAIKNEDRQRLENLLQLVITITSKEKKELLSKIDEKIKEGETVYKNLENRYCSDVPSQRGLRMRSMGDFQRGQLLDNLSRLNESLPRLRFIRATIQDAPVQEESANNNLT